jgi:hypothetical protein
LKNNSQKRTPAPLARERPVSEASGRAQLTLVEHALCPLDPAASLTEGLIHKSEFFYLDENRHQKTAQAKVVCPFGLSPVDEFYLWGLVALTLSQPEPSVEFYATPHFCLSELRVNTKGSGKGGKNYALFRQAIARLATVTYINNRFYDPVRGEHRDVAFGFFSYSLPVNPGSSRAWRFVWDPIFFEFCQAARGSLIFDLGTYLSLDVASRRLFLLLKKIFWRNTHSPTFDLMHLGVNILGIAPSVDSWNMKIKVAGCVDRLVKAGIVAPPEAGDGKRGGLFEKKCVGSYSLRLRRGPYFESPTPVASASSVESPLREPLKSIGFDDASVARILRKFKPQLIQIWADITLAAKERSPGFFKVGPEAYFMDNIEKAAQGTRTPPDWWYEHRKEEDRRERETKRSVLNLPPESKSATDEEKAFEEYLLGEGRNTFAEILTRLVRDFSGAGQTAREAERNATEAARTHLRNRFRRIHPRSASAASGASSSGASGSGPTPLSEVLKKIKLQ